MSFQSMTTLFALLTLLAGIAVLAFGALALAARVSEGAATVRDGAWDSVAEMALPLAFLVALTATLGSLYLSEVAHLIPCKLCWYQRIAMYPLPVILLVAWLRRDRAVWHYVLPIALIGAAIALYHYQYEWFPGQGSLVCSLETPCNVALFRKFGFVSIPLMALTGFVSISALVWIAGRRPLSTEDWHEV
jgi:disulfide bond formation protein DsbB